MAAAAPAPAPDSKGSIGQLVGALAIVSILAGGAGAFMALSVKPQSSPPTQTVDAEAPKDAGKSGAPAATALTVEQIPVVITNLKSPTDVWVRLEASMVFDHSQKQNPAVISGQLATDFLAYFRTLTLADLQTPDGLQDLREDLDDRATTRSHGAVHEILIRTLVFQ